MYNLVFHVDIVGTHKSSGWLSLLKAWHTFTGDYVRKLERVTLLFGTPCLRITSRRVIAYSNKDLKSLLFCEHLILGSLLYKKLISLTF